MLVLSRGKDDQVLFPTLGITVNILRVDGNKVRLGIDAPQDVPVYRHEVAQRIEAEQGPEALRPAAPAKSERKLSHAIRNRLHAASLGLHVLHRKLELNESGDAEAEIFRIFNELKSIENELSGGTSQAGPAGDAAHLRRALVVEDDDNERELLSGYLQMNGYHVETAVDGLQAMVKLTNQQRPDVVLLDMKMPRFDGSKTVSAIRRHPDYHDLVVFAVSGEAKADVGVTVGEDGVDCWFSKPLNPRELVAAMNAHLVDEPAKVKPK